MNTIKNLNISNLINNTSHFVNKMLAVEEQWLDKRVIDNKHELTSVYANICQQHAIENKWVLMINPEKEALNHLSFKTSVNVDRVLTINANKVTITLENIETALASGNCAAVIIPEGLLSENEIEYLTKSAQRGRTQCIIIKQPVLH